MGNRLSRLYTRTGDDGTTGLTGGDRINKDSELVSAMGAVDELSSVLGLLVTRLTQGPEADLLIRIQHQLFAIGGELSMPGNALLNDQAVPWLENHIDTLTGELGPLEEFILPGGCEHAALCHLARSISRRAERRLVSASRVSEIRTCLLEYMNRLSDLLFVLARKLNDLGDTEDIYWDKSVDMYQPG